MQHRQRKVGWQGGQRRKVGKQAANGVGWLVGWLDDTCCVTTVFIEFPAGQTLTRPCLNKECQSLLCSLSGLSRRELFTAILSTSFLAEW